jgi:hypothetical protein
MNRFFILTLAVSGAVAAANSSSVNAQHDRHIRPGHHSQYVVHDRHGHVVVRDSYYVRNGHYYYSRKAAGVHSSHYRPQEITFGGFSHVDDLAIRLEDLANQLCLDLYYNYSHNFEFRVTYAEAYQVLEVARFIHNAEHHQDRAAIQKRLQGLDDLFHHVQDDVCGWSRHHHRQIGTLGVLSKMDLLEDTLHHLMNDVGVSQAPGVNEKAPRPDDHEEEQAPAPLTLPTAFRQ